MAIPPVTNTTPAGTKTAGEKTAIDKEAFLKLLVAQLSHQDPLQPTEGTEFIAQLSQFAMVEQSIAQSSKLDTISTQMTGLSANEAAGLVGKTVTGRVEGKDVTGKVTEVSFEKGSPELQLEGGAKVSIGDVIKVGGEVR